jgi:hypothetical protein
VETKRINEAVRRNPERFPCDLIFEMTQEEVEYLRSQNATFKDSLNNRKYLPKVFTEQGVYMLSTVLKSDVATAYFDYYANIYKNERICPYLWRHHQTTRWDRKNYKNRPTTNELQHRADR